MMKSMLNREENSVKHFAPLPLPLLLPEMQKEITFVVVAADWELQHDFLALLQICCLFT